MIHSARFLVSNSTVDHCPKSSFPEYAFIGRSNVGKSSLINAMANNKKLAKTSGTPGKTKLINHFLINDAWCMVDLPGYGYAKISKQERNELKKLINGYFAKRKQLVNTFILIDSRHKPQDIDIDFINTMGAQSIRSLSFLPRLTNSPMGNVKTIYLSINLSFWSEAGNVFPHYLNLPLKLEKEKKRFSAISNQSIRIFSFLCLA